MKTRNQRTALLVVLLCAVAFAAALLSSPVSAANVSAPALHVAGNQLLDASNAPVRLHGVNYSGTEYACVQGWGFFDGPSDQAMVDRIKAFGANAVRVPLNEDCWLAINGSPATYSGANYRNTIIAWTHLLEANGVTPILELHWSHAGTTLATYQVDMMDRDHSIAFWQGVASSFPGDNAPIFDLFNEPVVAEWSCLRDGGTNGAGCQNEPFQVVGMQEVVTDIRALGSHNVIMVGGLSWANDLTQWLQYKPTDPDNNIAASWHIYYQQTCGDVACFNSQVAPVAASVPLIAGEFGDYSNKGNVSAAFTTTVLDWLDAHHASGYLAWTWDTWGAPESLITDQNGGLSAWGIQVKSEYAGRFGGTLPPSATATATTPPSATATPTATPAPSVTPAPTGTPAPSPSPTPTPIKLNGAQCAIIRSGVLVVGKCTGTFTPKP